MRAVRLLPLLAAGPQTGPSHGPNIARTSKPVAYFLPTCALTGPGLRPEIPGICRLFVVRAAVGLAPAEPVLRRRRRVALAWNHDPEANQKLAGSEGGGTTRACPCAWRRCGERYARIAGRAASALFGPGTVTQGCYSRSVSGCSEPNGRLSLRLISRGSRRMGGVGAGVRLVGGREEAGLSAVRVSRQEIGWKLRGTTSR
jgi:hypothetical protein